MTRPLFTVLAVLALLFLASRMTAPAATGALIGDHYAVTR